MRHILRHNALSMTTRTFFVEGIHRVATFLANHGYSFLLTLSLSSLFPYFTQHLNCRHSAIIVQIATTAFGLELRWFQ
ncbi:MAG: hypothetical protein M3347_11360, partial [Armatimonadota bacterium]|nr:hypothetical protein [Armatimonadota bacterium]